MDNTIINDMSNNIQYCLTLFDLSYDYTTSQLREKYIKSVLKYYPDKTNINKKYFKEILNAYQILNNNLSNKIFSHNLSENVLYINFKDPLTLLNEIYNNDNSNPFNSKINLKRY